MSKISDELKKKSKTPYQLIADKYETTAKYVSEIARGERVPKRDGSKGMMIKNAIKEFLNQGSINL